MGRYIVLRVGVGQLSWLQPVNVSSRQKARRGLSTAKETLCHSFRVLGEIPFRRLPVPIAIIAPEGNLQDWMPLLSAPQIV